MRIVGGMTWPTGDEPFRTFDADDESARTLLEATMRAAAAVETAVVVGALQPPTDADTAAGTVAVASESIVVPRRAAAPSLFTDEDESTRTLFEALVLAEAGEAPAMPVALRPLAAAPDDAPAPAAAASMEAGPVALPQAAFAEPGVAPDATVQDVSLAEATAAPATAWPVTLAFAPTDPLYATQWHLSRWATSRRSGTSSRAAASMSAFTTTACSTRTTTSTGIMTRRAMW